MSISALNLDVKDCCICLNEEPDYKKIITKCCKNMIHQRCLFQIIIHGHNSCPLCRQDLIIKEYFTRTEFISYTRQLTLSQRYMYITNIQNALYQVTYIQFQYTTNSSCLDYILYLFSRFINYIISFIFCYLQYIFCIFIFSTIFIIVLIYNNTNLKNMYKDSNKSITILDFHY